MEPVRLFPGRPRFRPYREVEAVAFNVRVEDVAEAAIFLSQQEESVNQIYNVSDGCYPTVEEALTLAAEVFGVKVPQMHVPLFLARMMAKVDGMLSRRRAVQIWNMTHCVTWTPIMWLIFQSFAVQDLNSSIRISAHLFNL